MENRIQYQKVILKEKILKEQSTIQLLEGVITTELLEGVTQLFNEGMVPHAK